MSSSKPFLVSNPRAFMMFQTIGLNTGRVRLETVIFGLSCATDGVTGSNASAQTVAIQAAAITARRRRGNLIIKMAPRFNLAQCSLCPLPQHGNRRTAAGERFNSLVHRPRTFGEGRKKSVHDE